MTKRKSIKERLSERKVDYRKYEVNYSEQSLWNKLQKYAKKIGCEGVRNALRLFYALDSSSIDLKTKAAIYGSLGYLILPLDIIPDIVPMIGFTDDISAIAGAITVASNYINASTKANADKKLSTWFGRNSC